MEPSPPEENAPLTLFPPDEIFDYTIRESPRARTVRLNMTPHDGLVIVIPTGYSRRRLPAIIKSKQSWIENARRWADDQRRQLAARPKPCIPDQIDLLAIGELWDVGVNQTQSGRTTTREHPELRLQVSGNTVDLPRSLAALSRWTGRKAHGHLVPWLRELGGETGLEFTKAVVGNQQTRWASCSPKGTISLNQKLLFLPPRLVRYVLVHELCHLKHMNHSRRFWALVARHEPSWRDRRRELGESWQLVPPWLDR
ncbi:MAG: SprT family zinc-dependent metalloprotease [Thermoleophilia bacterium]|nr:SprT family zinc-dependent metalloprotease [Thermoleophilia bacterium]